MKPSPSRHRHSLAALTGLVGVSLTLAGCGGGSSHSTPAAAVPPGVTHAVPFAAAASIAAPEHAAVARAVQALAAAELKLSQDIAPLAKANNFTSYLQALSGAAAHSRAGIASISSRGGDCALLQSGISAANSGVLSAALGTFSARVSVLRTSMHVVDADRAAVAKAATALTSALTKDPGAWRVPGVDEIGSTLTAVAKWQAELGSAITSAEGKAANAVSLRSRLSSRAAAVGASCHLAVGREKVRAVTAAAAASASPSAVASATSPTPGGSSSPAGSASAPVTTTSPPAPATTTPAPVVTTSPPAPTPSDTSPVPVETSPAPASTSPTPETTSPVPETTTPQPPAASSSSAAPESTVTETASPSPS